MPRGFETQTSGGSGGGGGSTTASTIGVDKVVNSLTEAYAIAVADEKLYMTVYDKQTEREYILMSLPASVAANWVIKGDGDTEDGYNPVVTNFSATGKPTIKCNNDQMITSASLPLCKKYKIIATADIVVTFDLPVLGSSPLLSGMTWGLRAGSKLTFYKTADGSAIDGEVN